MEKKFEHWEDEIRHNFKSNNFNKKILRTKKRKLFTMYIALTILIFSASISVIITSIVISIKKPFNEVALSYAIVILLEVFMHCGMSFFVFKAFKNHKLWQKEMYQLLSFEKYYQLAINETVNSKIKLVDISEKFSVAPWRPLNKKNFLCWNNNKILNMIYDDKIFISFGTVSTTWSKNKTRYSYPYLSCEVLYKNLNVNVRIKKNNLFNIVIANTELESTVFEKIYSIKSIDQIEIRKLLTPTVIENLTSITMQTYDIPKMTFKNKFLVFSFKKEPIYYLNKCNNKLVCFNFKKNPEYWATELIRTINHDMILLLNSLKWLFCFDQLTT